MKSHKRVARIMREEALTPRRIRRFLATTDSDHREPIYENLAPGFRPRGPNQLWVADTTYIRLRSGFVYLAVLLDAWSRRVVGYAVGNTLVVRLTLAALNAAVESRKPEPGLIHHSDRGAQYAAQAYRDRIEQLGFRGSMSRKANPDDNALAESFMKTLEHEEVLALSAMAETQQPFPHFAYYNIHAPTVALVISVTRKHQLKHGLLGKIYSNVIFSFISL